MSYNKINFKAGVENKQTKKQTKKVFTIGVLVGGLREQLPHPPPPPKKEIQTWPVGF